MRYICVLLSWVCLGSAAALASLEDTFRDVPAADRPWVYYWWLNGNVDEATIARDLAAMRDNGIGGLLLFDARGYHDDRDHVPAPPARMDFMSPEWRRMVRYTLGQAEKNGLQVSINLSICAGALKGPWPVGDDAPKQLVWLATNVTGPRHLAIETTPPPDRRQWPVAVLAIRGTGAATAAWSGIAPATNTSPAAEEVIDLTERTDWDVPAGDWTLLRFGGELMTNHEYDVDILDPRAVSGHFDRMARPLLDDAGPLAGKTLTHFYSVSWEGAAPTWTRGLDEEFQHRRGYALRPWLPALAGVTVRSRAETARFLHDYYCTLADCFAENFYGTLRDLSHRAGLQWHAESGGPWDRKLAAFAHADQLAFLAVNDMPQGEFWWPRRALNRPVAMTAHTYGRRLAAAEAFTHMTQHWSAYPATLKPRADEAFCDGINQLVWHTFTAAPEAFGRPGPEYFAGTHLNPNVTWWPWARPFLDYLARGQHLLRQGRFVAEACVYIGDRPYLHWDQGGTNWGPQATLPWPRGHAFDVITTDVLTRRLTARDGQLVLPDGMTYRLLIVDPAEETMPPAALHQIAALQKAGVPVVAGRRRPQGAPGLADYPACDAEVRALTETIWASAATSAVAALQQANLPPDCESPWPYTHRRDGETDIYFLAGQGQADCIFRIIGRQPELWDPVNGRSRDATGWRQGNDGRTVVPLALASNGSMFVVFRRMAAAAHAEAPGPAQPASVDVTGPWTVSFEPGRGAPAEATFDQLVRWDQHPDEGIRHFSGRATYRAEVTLTAEQAQPAAHLCLGDVFNLARVRINGRDLGIAWCAPWEVSTDGTLRPGRNQVEIEVVNTWVNRLIGDAALAPEKRITRTNVGFEAGDRRLKPHQSTAAGDPLRPAGLPGPVRIRLDTLPAASP